MIIGILGGTFDPPHLGHLGAARNVLDSALVNQIWFIPCLQHRFGKTPAPFKDRMAMCHLLAEDDPRMLVSDIETELKMPGHTLDLVIALKEKHTNDQFRLIAGTDIYYEKDSWFNYDEIIKLAPPIYVERKGVSVIPEPTLPAPTAVSSTLIRQLIEAESPPSSQVPRSILDYIADKGLYRRKN